MKGPGEISSGHWRWSPAWKCRTCRGRGCLLSQGRNFKIFFGLAYYQVLMQNKSWTLDSFVIGEQSSWAGECSAGGSI